jgi:phosphoribosyl 1,2-cyclic phosphodiesterase/CheY-like chemotaxis protein
MKIYLVDDDPDMTSLLGRLLRDAGHEVCTSDTGKDILAAIEAFTPDCLLLDIMLPGVDGLSLLHEIRASERLAGLRVIVVSAKPFVQDRRDALAAGADAFLNKPIDRAGFAATVAWLAGDRVKVRFWGVRGTLPVPGEGSLRYGGNTSCVSLAFPSGQLFVFDAGTGIRLLGEHLLAQKRRVDARLFISHPHYDHINALPFFGPLHVQGNDVEILGTRQGGKDIRTQVSAQMDDVYFPITIRELAANVRFRDLGEGTHDVDGIQVRAMLLSHPGQCLGYRIDYRGRSICYVTDNELFPAWTPHANPRYVQMLTDFVRDTDMLVTDATYADAEYPARVTWGHSCISEVATLAAGANVKNLYLFHHDPGQHDGDIDAKLAACRTRLDELGAATVCHAPHEGQEVLV